ncbi:hypothetical protein GCM10010276_86210 [Streptomyces longisporus]|uniref:Uncharacterized protein n=1 Tax=Streptomyces longisporus TaxID=1948 RepID=A0ABP6AT27_STRLO
MHRHDLTGTIKANAAHCRRTGCSPATARAARAFTWLLAVMSVTVLLLMGVGLPTHDPDLATTGTLNGSRISLNTRPKRITWTRAEKATRVAVNSVASAPAARSSPLPYLDRDGIPPPRTYPSRSRRSRHPRTHQNADRRFGHNPEKRPSRWPVQHCPASHRLIFSGAGLPKGAP